MHSVPFSTDIGVLDNLLYRFQRFLFEFFKKLSLGGSKRDCEGSGGTTEREAGRSGAVGGMALPRLRSTVFYVEVSSNLVILGKAMPWETTMAMG